MRITTELERQAVERGLTREAIASLLGKRARSVYFYMKGQRDFSLQEGLQLGKIFGVPAETILLWQKMPPNSAHAS